MGALARVDASEQRYELALGDDCNDVIALTSRRATTSGTVHRFASDYAETCEQGFKLASSETT